MITDDPATTALGPRDRTAGCLPVAASRAYDVLAAIYDRHWGPVVERDFLPVVAQLLLVRMPPGAHILDVCCGTGQLAAALTERGYRVTGLDCSAAMLRRARRNAPRASFFQADARCFTLRGGFDAAVSTFDSLNHMMNPAELRAALGCVAGVLAPGGWFLFDLNTEEAYRERWGDSFGFVDRHTACVVRTRYEPDRRIGVYELTVFWYEGRWHRRDLKVRQYCHEPRAVVAALQDAGLDQVATYDAQPLGFEGHYGRLFVLSRKTGRRAVP